MSIVRVKSFFISGVNCNWSSVIRSKKTAGQRFVKRNLTCLRHWWSCFPTVRIPASTRQVVAASLCRGVQLAARRHPPSRCFGDGRQGGGYPGNEVVEAACLLANAFGVRSRIKLLGPRLRVGTRASTPLRLPVRTCYARSIWTISP